jgi:hypothetical protein
MAGKKEPPDWDQFEVYKGDEQGSQRPVWLDRLIHFVALAVLLVLVFAAGGAFSYLVVARRMALIETPTSAWTRFIIGGVMADVTVLGWIYRKRP